MRKGLCFLTASEISDHQGGGSVTDQRSLPHDIQEAEKAWECRRSPGEEPLKILHDLLPTNYTSFSSLALISNAVMCGPIKE